MAKYRFEQIAINSTEKKKPVEKDRFTYIGLEHLDSTNLKVTRFGSDVAPVGEKLVMRKGDVLFGKRRAYQKKVAIAPFDGIFSAHGMVLRPNVEIIDPDFFPLFISSDYFLNAAIKISVGSLSPTINWRDLKILEFDLPDLKTQRKLAAVLWSINNTMESYKKLISATDELVKSQFMELFGDQTENPFGLPVMSLGETCTFYSGTGFPNKYQGNTSGTYPFFKVGDISRNVQEGNVHLADAENYVEPDVVKAIKGTIIPAGTVVFAKIGEALRLNRRAVTTRECLVDNNVMGIRPDSSMLTEEYFLQFMVGLDMNEYSAATALPSVRKSTLEKVEILVPDIAAQNRFSELIRQSDKSKFTALRCSTLNMEEISRRKSAAFWH